MFARFLLTALLAAISTSHEVVFAQSPSTGAEEQCPISLELTPSEQKEFTLFYRRMGSLSGHHGKFYFQTALSGVLKRQNPTKKVIETSPLYMEKILNIVDQHQLIHNIAMTVGTRNKNWISFASKMKSITIDGGYIDQKRDLKKFAQIATALVEDIKNLPIEKMQGIRSAKERKKPWDPNVVGELKAETVLMIASMQDYLAQWSGINKELARLRAQARNQKLLLYSIVIGGGAILIASTVFTPMLVVAAGPYAASYAGSIMVGAQVARFSAQVGVGVVAGAIGAPTAQVTGDALNILLTSNLNSKNNRTVYACELNKLFTEWQERGVSPYVNSALIGGITGFAAVATWYRYGASALLWATAGGVTASVATSGKSLFDNTMMAIDEYGLAMEALEKGDKAAALEHLHASRGYASAAGSDGLQMIIVTALAASVGKDFPKALKQGGSAILGVFANSSDTLPTAVQVLIGEQ